MIMIPSGYMKTKSLFELSWSVEWMNNHKNIHIASLDQCVRLCLLSSWMDWSTCGTVSDHPLHLCTSSKRLCLISGKVRQLFLWRHQVIGYFWILGSLCTLTSHDSYQGNCQAQSNQGWSLWYQWAWYHAVFYRELYPYLLINISIVAVLSITSTEN